MLKSGQWFFSPRWRICFCYTFLLTRPFKINHTTIHSFTHSSPSSITFLKYPFPVSLLCKLFQCRSHFQNNVKSQYNGSKWHHVCWVQSTWVTNCSMPQNHCTPEQSQENYFLVPWSLLCCSSSQHFSQNDSVISLLVFWNLHKHH